MNMRHVRTIIKKEMKELKNDKAVILGMIIVPLILTVIVPILFFVIGSNEKSLKSFSTLTEAFVRKAGNMLPDSISNDKAPLYLMYRYLFTPIILIIPVMISNVLSSYSFVGEKEKKTIESLLYTPVNQRSLIMGKTLASAIPSLVITWVFAVIYSIIANIAGKKLFNETLFPNIDWIVMLVLIIPAITFLSIILVIIVSQKMNSSKSAQSVSILFVLPLIGSIVSQAVGAIVIDSKILFVVFGVIVLLDIIVFRFAARNFNKEKYILNM